MIKKAVLTQVINKSIKIKSIMIKGIPVRDASACVDAIFKTLAEALIKGEKVEIRGFGTFSVREVKARKSSITLNGNDKVPAHGRIVFRPSQKLRQAVWNKIKE